MTGRDPLPFTVMPHRSEALHSWLERLSVPYRLKPWQLLHELGFDPFAGKNAQRQQPVQAFFDIVDLRRLAQLTRVDPSRFGLDRLCPPEWTLANDAWVMRCWDCERDDQRENLATYERSAWRNAARTFCPRHRTPLTLKRYGWREKELNEDAEDTTPPLTALEVAIARQVREFEQDIAGALRGRAPTSAAGTLTASAFLMIAQDLLSFAVETWEIKGPRSARTIDQQADQMNRHAATLFRHEPARGHRVRCDGSPPIQLRHLADPAARRAALWLVLQVIWYIPSGERLALRLGDTPQDSFFGYPCHAGWAWLTERASAWPTRYRRRHWHGFVEDAHNLKAQVTPLKG